MVAKSKVLRVNAKANAKSKKVKRVRVLKPQMQDQVVQVEMLGGAATEEDIRISENMAALELAVRNKIPGAILLDKLITGESSHVRNEVKYMFSGVKDGMKYIKCEHCNDLFGHECLQKREVH